jgi:uncharacterized protein (DUF2249 family)
MRFRITLICDDVPHSLGAEAAQDITEAFRLHYLHEQNVVCSWNGKSLKLVAENDHDPEGLNLMDEFSDNLCAYVGAFDGEMKVVSIERIG